VGMAGNRPSTRLGYSSSRDPVLLVRVAGFKFEIILGRFRILERGRQFLAQGFAAGFQPTEGRDCPRKLLPLLSHRLRDGRALDVGVWCEEGGVPGGQASSQRTLATRE
jgi:hypothetical protein